MALTFMRDALRDEAKQASEDWLRAPAPFAERLSRGRWKRAPHLDLVSDRIAEIADHPIFLMVNMPPRHGKSELISRWTPVWFLKRWPWKRVLLVSYQAGFATDWGADAKDTFTENQQELELRIRQDTKSKARWKIQGFGGGMVATGVGGPVTGRGADLVIIDDPIKNQKEAMSPVYREAVKQWYRGTLRTRLQPGASIIILMTRWHQDDLCGWLLNEYSGESEEGEELQLEAPEQRDPWETINLKAIADPTEAEPDPLGRAPGEALWPEMYDVPELARLRYATGPFWWSAEYQGSPRPEGGGVFKEGFFQYFNPDEFEDLKLTRFVQQWDTAFKEKQVNDRSVCITVAEGKAGYYILDLWVGRPDFPKLTDAAKAQYGKWVPDRVRVEDKASGQSLVQQLRRDSKVPIVANKAVDDKVIRAHSVSGIVEAGRVWLPQRAPWLSEFLAEVCGFPTATHDDITDAFVYALMYYKPRRLPRLGRREMTETSQSKWKGVG